MNTYVVDGNLPTANTSTYNIDTSSLSISNTGALTGTVTIGGAGNNYIYNTGAGMGGMSSITGSVTIPSGGYTSVTSVSMPTITVADIQGSMFTWGNEFDNRFPDWDRIQKMCDEYPGLKIAFEKFKTTY